MNDNVAKAIASLIVTAKELEGIPVYLHGKLANPPEKQLQSKAMTHKDLRDIAAYWGAECTYQENWGTGWQDMSGPIQQFLWEVHGKDTPFVYGDTIRGLKLHLRPISSLTDEELQQLKYELGFTLGDFQRGYANCFDLNNGDFILYFDGGIKSGYEYNDYFNPVPSILKSAQNGFAYLQSIHVYVPGTIDEQFVELR